MGDTNTTRSLRTTSLSVDAEQASRLLSVAQTVDLYDSRMDASDDDWEAVISLLIDHFEADER